jgi:hypothetical protein
MIDWAARARARFAQSGREGTDKTDITRLSSVLSGGSPPLSENHSGSDERTAVRRSSNPYLSPDEADECHHGGWDDGEIARFEAWQAELTALGRADAEHLSELMVLMRRRKRARRMQGRQPTGSHTKSREGRSECDT